jgi:starch synthase (maltosyl-transferring)
MAGLTHTIVPRVLAFSEPSAQGVAACAALGFTHALFMAKPGRRSSAETLTDAELACFVDTARAHQVAPWLESRIECPPPRLRFALPPFAGPFDPRRPDALHSDHAAPALEMSLSDWSDRLQALARRGIAGFFWRRPDATPPDVTRVLIERVRNDCPDISFIADTIGLSHAALRNLEGVGFDYCLSSLPRWDGRANWFVEEHAALVAIAPVIATLGLPDQTQPRSSLTPAALLALAANTGNGVLMPFGFERSAVRCFSGQIRMTAAALTARRVTLRSLVGADAAITALLRSESPDPRTAETAALILLNPDPALPHSPEPGILARTAGDFIPAICDGALLRDLPPGEIRQVQLKRAEPVRSSRPDAMAAADNPRVVIERITPSLDDGAFAVKRIHGETLVVEADIFADGHEQLAAEIIHCSDDSKAWSRVKMTHIGNDRWRGEFQLQRIGRHYFAIEAFLDRWGGFVRDLIKKREAGQSLDVELMEGLALIRAAGAGTAPDVASALADILARIDASADGHRIDLLVADELRALMAATGDRPFRIRSFSQPVQVDRQAAAFASWYELFPRSQTDDPSRPGKLLDVIPRLPAIRRMGFDVLYFPPIHPIGKTNRKGRNNALVATTADPGSPYAIGGIQGGHDAIHPDLGTLDDFRVLFAAARDHGLEIALDFAIQCSPDHPWLAEHKDWFAWRADGSLKYAENPPKKYEDIVNVDFYAPGAIPGLWLALRDVVQHWINQGVRIFRVDNPHTKPLPFWRWLIDDIHASNPDIIFLAEAFTRPKMMARLAKIGFTQSYTYFTWRNDKRELTEYLTELNGAELRECFRPHFFVNTPDINPLFLQSSGRAGFLIRAALAATLSGLWGIYSGYELCESAALPGREEYLDSEKYQIRPRDWSAPGNIIEEIATLNRIRRAEPALQTHLGLTFYNAFNDQILYFGKALPGQTAKILVAVSLDPHAAQQTDLEVPLWEWDLPDDAQSEVTDLLNNHSFVWTGKIQSIRLTPSAPYAIWRARPAGAA